MKTTLQFSDDEEHEAKLALHSRDIYAALWRTSEDLARLVNDRSDLAFTDAQEVAIRGVISNISEALSDFDY